MHVCFDPITICASFDLVIVEKELIYICYILWDSDLVGGDTGVPISHIPDFLPPNIPYPRFFTPNIPYPRFFTPNIPYPRFHSQLTISQILQD